VGPQICDSWIQERIKDDEISRYRENNRDFIPEGEICALLRKGKGPDAARIREILQKSCEIKNLTPAETALLIQVEEPTLLAEMRETALEVKRKVYDNRIVTFAPLYLGNYCVNNCEYCGFKRDNKEQKRKTLSENEIVAEIRTLAGEIGHKRLIAVYGEHPRNDVDYIISSLRTIYGVRLKVKGHEAGIRRVNVNAPPFSIQELKRLNEVGIGTYQVFQETYHKPTYARVHPADTLKGHYDWRLYAMHRALEAGVDDVGIGVLFGLYDWKFEVLGLVYHAWELENRFGIGPHTISFPRLEPALNASLANYREHLVSDEDFLKIITVLRLAIPYTGLILTARENPGIRKQALGLGITQMDASSRLGIGSYGADSQTQTEDRQQFMLGDTRSLDDVVRELAERGMITSFCTAGYRCGRTGKKIMDLLRTGTEGKFCKLNAVLTYREWLDDFSSEETRRVAEPVLCREIQEIKEKLPQWYDSFIKVYEGIRHGKRDLYF